jgi:hypothetical protein
LIRVDPKTLRQERPSDNPEIRREMTKIAEKRRRFCYRRIGTMLGRNGSPRDESPDEETCDSLTDARPMLAIRHDDCINVRLHSSPGNKTQAEARRTRDQSERAKRLARLANPSLSVRALTPPESFQQCRLRPRYEGFSPSYSRNMCVDSCVRLKVL